MSNKNQIVETVKALATTDAAPYLLQTVFKMLKNFYFYQNGDISFFSDKLTEKQKNWVFGAITAHNEIPKEPTEQQAKVIKDRLLYNNANIELEDYSFSIRHGEFQHGGKVWVVVSPANNHTNNSLLGIKPTNWNEQL